MNLDITGYTKQEVVEMYKRNVNTIYRLAFLYLRNSADAEDATQTIFLKIIKSSPHFSCIEHEKAWYITVTKNHCKDLLKSFWRTHRVELNNLPDVSDEPSQQDDFCWNYFLPCLQNIRRFYIFIIMRNILSEK